MYCILFVCTVLCFEWFYYKLFKKINNEKYLFLFYIHIIININIASITVILQLQYQTQALLLCRLDT